MQQLRIMFGNHSNGLVQILIYKHDLGSNSLLLDLGTSHILHNYLDFQNKTFLDNFQTLCPFIAFFSEELGLVESVV